MSIAVEVAYAGPEGQFLLRVELPEGATTGDAIRASGIAARLPGVEIGERNVGIWSRVCGLSAALRDGDRVEIYRPLLADPKETRRRRAEEQKRR
jgi:putative ubiquitin-RnfH superfamily antitoxin RatB of RatAB toxin-antitoxin module